MRPATCGRGICMSAGVAERMPSWRPEFSFLIESNPAMLVGLILGGYRIGQLNDTIAKAGGEFYSTGLPSLPEVTFDNVRYDLQVRYSLQYI